MDEPAGDIHKEDGGLASEDQRYLPDFDRSYAVSGYDQHPAPELHSNTSEQLHAWYNGPSLAPSMSEPVHPAQPWAPDQHFLKYDNNLLSSHIFESHPSNWLPQSPNGPVSNGSPRVYEPISMNVNTDGGLYSQMVNSLSTHDFLPPDMQYDVPYPGTLVDDYACGHLPLETPYDLHTVQVNLNDLLGQGVSSGSPESYVPTALGSTGDEWLRLQCRAADSLFQPMDLESSHEMNSCVSYASDHTAALITSTWLAPAIQSMAWSPAHSPPAQALSIWEKPITSKRKRHTLDGEHHELSLGEVEKRVSKQARVPQSSVNILSFRGRDDPPKRRGHRSESAKQDMQGLALVGGSCTHCVHIKKKCDRQLPCAMCAKRWNRYSSRTPPKAKHIDRLSPDKSSGIARRTKLALRQIYDDMTAVRDSALNLPRLLSIVDGLKPSQKRLMQSLLMHLPRRIRQDLGCYFYIFMIMGRTQSLQTPTLETSSPRDILDQWHVLEAAALFSVRNMIHIPELVEEYTFVSNIGRHFPGINNPPNAYVVRQIMVRDKERLTRDVYWNVWDQTGPYRTKLELELEVSIFEELGCAFNPMLIEIPRSATPLSTETSKKHSLNINGR